MRKADLSDHVFLVNSVPHAWLFPHMAAIVHSGAAPFDRGLAYVGVMFEKEFKGQQVPNPPPKELSEQQLSDIFFATERYGGGKYLYHRNGFVEYGRLPEALCIEGQYYDEILMIKPMKTIA
ncbi:MAG: hypothetical protein HC860_25830 [Alkalinema sp. RU_4_3]|nr:hypothetical protein [Alkalinema sp. RU_4_3]